MDSYIGSCLVYCTPIFMSTLGTVMVSLFPVKSLNFNCSDSPMITGTLQAEQYRWINNRTLFLFIRIKLYRHTSFIFLYKCCLANTFSLAFRFAFAIVKMAENSGDVLNLGNVGVYVYVCTCTYMYLQNVCKRVCCSQA